MKKIVIRIYLRYLRTLARLQLLKIAFLNRLRGKKLITVGITGSAGKTSCLLACEAALKPQFKVKTNLGGNSESGIPLQILGLKMTHFSPAEWIKIALLAPLKLLTNWHYYQVFLIEMGIDAPYPPKNMSYLLKIVQPDIGIFLNVTSVHLMNFDSIEAIAREKAKLVNSTPVSILNLADPYVKKFSHPPGLTIDIIPVDIKIPHALLPGIYDVNFGAAIALALHLGLTSDQTIANIRRHFRLPPGRSSAFPGIKQSRIIDSSYNSSPLAAAEMLRLLSLFKSPRIAVLGDMRELGTAGASSHKKLYSLALKTADTIISVGPETKKYFGAAAVKFDFWWQAADYLTGRLPQHSTVLVKGSQNTLYLEELVKVLLRHPSDKKLLCRQSPYWLKTKSQFRSLHT